MCGISGIIFNKSNNINYDFFNKKIQIMLETQRLRGPDSDGVFQDENCILGHNRLSIIDLNSSGNQPMMYDKWVLVFNGEIYNFKEIKNELASFNIQFSGTSDTEVLLKCISYYGVEETLNKIRGIFAFCAYDKIENRYYLARDRMGEKPLFFFKDNENNIYFASNPSAIISATEEIKWYLDYEALWEYFKLGGIFSHRTLFKNLYRVDSSELLIINKSIITKNIYWVPKFITDVTEQDLLNEINISINQKLIADVPIALFLSGGVDSSYVSMIAKNIDCVHLISNELSFAKEVARINNSKLHVIEPKNLSEEDLIDLYVTFSGEATMSGLIPQIVCDYLNKNNYKVAITANGADELFFGYIRTPTPLLNDDFFINLYKNNNVNINLPSYNKENFINHIFRKDDSYTIKNGIIGDLNSLLNKETTKLNENFSESAQYRWIDLMTYVKGDLNNSLDFSSMSKSVEVRAPFLDHKVVELALSMNENVHITSQYGRKTILKKELEKNNLDKNIWDREKMGFSLNKEYLYKISNLKQEAVTDLKNHKILNINLNNIRGRDMQYLSGAALGFWFWKKRWIDTGIVNYE